MPGRLRARMGEAWRLIGHSLSGRLLLLTLLFAMLTQVLIFVPSVGRYHRSLLDSRAVTAQIAILPLTEPGGRALSSGLKRELLVRAGAEAVILKRPYMSELYLRDEMPGHYDLAIDLRDNNLFAEMYQALDCIFAGGNRILNVIAPTRIPGARTVDVILSEGDIRAQLLDYARGVFYVAVFISFATALLVFISLYLVFVRPMRRLTRAMIAFRDNPEDASRIMESGSRADEVGIAERELAAMQRDIYGFLQQKARLAALGAAVAKIQHDLRNILASAQLASDRLSSIDDPVVQRLTPRLVASIGRAVSLATNTLRFGRADEHPPERRRAPLAPVIAEAAEAGISEKSLENSVAWTADVQHGLEIDADPEQLYRILLNLVRNAAEALGARGGAIRLAARRQGRHVTIDVEDDGPGIAEAARGRLFQPFATSTRPGGSGLGLAIARDLARAHGGDVTLVTTGPGGTAFRIDIPDREDN
jgi:signal transduction histidine kinase